MMIMEFFLCYVIRTVNNFEELKVSNSNKILLMESDIQLEEAINLEGAKIAGGDNTIVMTNLGFGSLLNSVFSDITIITTHNLFASEIVNCSFVNLVINLTSSSQSFLLADIISNSVFNVLNIEFSERDTKLVFGDVQQSQFSNFQTVNVESIEITAINNTRFRYCIMNSLTLNAETQANSLIVDSSIYQSDIINLPHSYCYSEVDNLINYIQLHEYYRPYNNELALYTFCSGNCKSKTINLMTIYRPDCEFLIEQECYNNPCNVLEDTCFGNGECVDFECECNKGIAANYCYESALRQEYYSYDYMLLIAVLVLLCLSSIVFFLYLYTRGKNINYFASLRLTNEHKYMLQRYEYMLPSAQSSFLNSKESFHFSNTEHNVEELTPIKIETFKKK